MKKLIFSNKFRVFKIFLPLFLICLLVIYGEIYIPVYYPGYDEAVRNPDKFFNKQIYFGGKILKIYKSNFILKSENKYIIIQGSMPRSALGANISGKAIYLKNHSLIMKDFHISNTRIFKILLSLIPLIIIFYFFIKEYKFEFKTMQFKKI